MAYGLQVFKADGSLAFDSTMHRLNRLILTIDWSLTPGGSADYSIPGYTDDGTWAVIVTTSSASGLPVGIYRHTGFITIYDIFAYESLAGKIIVLRH